VDRIFVLHGLGERSDFRLTDLFSIAKWALVDGGTHLGGYAFMLL
jgi:hypothetical protein